MRLVQIRFAASIVQAVLQKNCSTEYADKKERNIPHVQYKEIQKWAVAKSYVTNGLLIYD